MPGRPAPSQWPRHPRPISDWHTECEPHSSPEPPKVFPKPDDYNAIGVRVMCNGHDLFAARTLNDAADAVQYLKALCAVQEQGADDE